MSGKTESSLLQLTMTASFLPPQAPHGSSRMMATTATHTGSDSSLATAGLYPPVTPTMSSASDSGPDTAGALATPNPFPGMKRGEEAYAHVEGITVWEGEAAVMRDDGDAQLATSEGEKKDANRMVFRSRHGWTVVWRGSLPIGSFWPPKRRHALLTLAAYVRTPILNPLLGLTVFATLRDSERHTHRRAGLSLDTASVRSVESDGEADEPAGTGVAVFEEIDLLGGLGGETISRLAIPDADSCRQASLACEPFGSYRSTRLMRAEPTSRVSLAVYRRHARDCSFLFCSILGRSSRARSRTR